MTAPRRVVALALLALPAIASCTRVRPPATPAVAVEPAPPPTPPWEATLDSVRSEIAGHRLQSADRILAAFSAAHAGSPEAEESDFWRALLRADPDNADGSAREALAALDQYLARGPQSPRHVEVLLLRRLVASTDSLRTALAAARTAADQREKARADEIARKQLELDSVKVELDRIKRRLTGRRP